VAPRYGSGLERTALFMIPESGNKEKVRDFVEGGVLEV
jgi:hypothetical protein